VAELRELSLRWRNALPEALAERVFEVGSAAEISARATHVLYWMRAAPRGHENPALDAAIAAAEHLGLPAYVFHGLSPQPLLASPRRLDFALDAAGDVARELQARGVPYAVHVVRRAEKTRPLAALLRGAALLVTELAPLEPERSWVASLAAQGTPLWCVDGASVIPIACAPRAPLALHRYREQTREERLARLLRPWRNVAPRAPYAAPRWPFEPTELATSSRAALHAECALLGRETATSAGGASAGYGLWSTWKLQGLRAWPAERCDPSALEGARLAQLLDAGHLSPRRLARDAALAGNAGAKRWLLDHAVRGDHAAALGERLEPSRNAIELQGVKIPETLRDHGVLPRAARWAWLRALLRQLEPAAAEALVAAALARFATSGPSPRELAEIRAWRSRRSAVEIEPGLAEEAPAP
jgi:hypothetical protein